MEIQWQRGFASEANEANTTPKKKGALASRICRFVDHEGVERLGQPFDNPYNELLMVADPFESKDGSNEARLVLEPPLKMAKMLHPIPVVPSIICCGLNYKKHAEEVGIPIPRSPVLVSKTPNTLNNPYDPIIIPKTAPDEVDYEGELAIVIGKTCKDVSADEAMSYILGYTCANDVTARRWQGKKGGGQWYRGKSFDTFLPLGPSITAAWVLDPSDLAITTKLNGEVVQSSRTSDMIWSVAELVSFCSTDTTLHPGTVILTGTPEGVGYTRDPPLYLKSGDRVEVEIEGIGKLINTVK